MFSFSAWNHWMQILEASAEPAPSPNQLSKSTIPRMRSKEPEEVHLRPPNPIPNQTLPSRPDHLFPSSLSVSQLFALSFFSLYSPHTLQSVCEISAVKTSIHVNRISDVANNMHNHLIIPKPDLSLVLWASDKNWNWRFLSILVLMPLCQLSCSGGDPVSLSHCRQSNIVHAWDNLMYV